tara:strand:+ start:4860 stop:5072 length:213 start_codon:yes stop_codon:yes gene_type:complete
MSLDFKKFLTNRFFLAAILVAILSLIFCAVKSKESKKIQTINKPTRLSSPPMHTFSNLKTPGWNWGRLYT